MENKPILSICIPTYNRADYLKQCLDNIVCQFDDEQLKASIEVVVSDDTSKDNTQDLVKEYQSHFDNVKYFKNEKNVGMTENIINSVLKSNGKYCWIIGDDDFIQNGSLKFIVDFLSKEDTPLLSVNFHPFINVENSLKKVNDINEKHLSHYSSPEEFYRKGCLQGILGIFIFNKESFLKTDRTNYEEFWSYYEIILRMLPSSNLNFTYLSYPVIFIGQDYRWNKNGGALFCTIHAKRVFEKLRKFGYDKKFIDQEVEWFSKSLPKSLLGAKSYNLKCSLDNYKLVYKETHEYPLSLVLATMIFLIPNSVVKIMKTLKNKLKNK
jgi:glycosyltransferase involved in cell wall biosynthesis